MPNQEIPGQGHVRGSVAGRDRAAGIPLQRLVRPAKGRLTCGGVGWAALGPAT